MKRHIIYFFVIIVIIVSCATLSSTAGEVYEGAAQGYRGPIKVQVRVHDGAITEIIADSMEDRFVGSAAIEELIDIVIENNSTDVDVISGATVSSRGFLSAVNNALQGL